IKREAETSVVLLNNQTLVLGGLIQDTVTNNDQGIPYMKSIPILGYLFGFKEKKLAKTELLLLITPRVIGTAVDAARITNEMRRTTPELNEAIRSAPRAPAVLPPPGSPVPVPMPTGAPATPSSSTTPPPGVGAPAPMPTSTPGPGGLPSVPAVPPAAPSAPPPKPSGSIPAPAPVVGLLGAPTAVPGPALDPTALSTPGPVRLVLPTPPTGPRG